MSASAVINTHVTYITFQERRDLLLHGFGLSQQTLIHRLSLQSPLAIPDPVQLRISIGFCA